MLKNGSWSEGSYFDRVFWGLYVDGFEYATVSELGAEHGADCGRWQVCTYLFGEHSLTYLSAEAAKTVATELLHDTYRRLHELYGPRGGRDGMRRSDPPHRF